MEANDRTIMIRAKRIGAVTIGQSPREDVVPQLRNILAAGWEVIEVGALDGLSAEEIHREASESTGSLLVTRLRGGREARIPDGLVTPRLQVAVSSLQDRVDLIVVLCTGDFPGLRSYRPVLYPGPLLRSAVGGLAPTRLGVLTPAADQIAHQRMRWTGVAEEVIVEHASPYGSPEELTRASERLRQAGVDTVAMDCIGYTRDMKRRVRGLVERPVLAATTLLVRVVGELLD